MRSISVRRLARRCCSRSARTASSTGWVCTLALWALIEQRKMLSSGSACQSIRTACLNALGKPSLPSSTWSGPVMLSRASSTQVSALMATSADWIPFQLDRYSARVITRPCADAPASASACAVCSTLSASARDVPAATPYASWTVWSKPASCTGASFDEAAEGLVGNRQADQQVTSRQVNRLGGREHRGEGVARVTGLFGREET